MKCLLATMCLAALVWAEPPPSNSYLPPSPAGRASTGGYPSGGPHSNGLNQGQFGGGPHSNGPNQGLFGGGPQVVAARTFDNGHDHHHAAGAAGANGFARTSGGHKAAGRFGGLNEHDQHKHGKGGAGAQGYDRNASPFGRNGIDEVEGEPASYNFGYMVNDFQEGTDFGHHEERQDERAEGEYHVVLPDGRKQTVSYEADEHGFKPQISYEDTDAVGRANGGYDDNANNLHGNHGNGFNHGGHGSQPGRSGGY